jgi:para-nitrobenzyl esterase
MSSNSSRTHAAIALITVLCLSPGRGHGEPSVRPVVTTTAGKIAGDASTAIRVFRGIPFAAPPVGELRWALPQPVAPWKDVRDATRFGAPCPVPAGLTQGAKGDPGSVHGPGYDVWVAKMEAGGSEDCLTLNVWTPDAKVEKAPVMVFFSPTGSGSIPVFDGATFARDGVVFVSPNNRLFTQSMFAHPALTAASAPAKPPMRLHEWDRIVVLEWVRDNVRAFGGDPHNVTVFGESNSAASILALMTAPAAKGLFHKAIIQSGTSRGPLLSREGTERIGVELVRMAGLDGEKATIEQLRALPLDALPFFAAGIADERLLPLSVEDAFARGQTHDVALLVGGNTWDGSSLRYPPANIVARTPADVLEAYEGLSGDALGYAIYTDEHVNAPARWYAAAHAAKGAPVYHYVYSYVSSFRKQPFGAAHGEELPFVFDTWDKIPGIARLINDDDRRVTKMMHECWISFARSGKPECATVPEWPTYDATTNWTMELGKESKLHQHYRKAQYDAQDRYHARMSRAPRDGREVLDALRGAQNAGGSR